MRKLDFDYSGREPAQAGGRLSKSKNRKLGRKAKLLKGGKKRQNLIESKLKPSQKKFKRQYNKEVSHSPQRLTRKPTESIQIKIKRMMKLKSPFDLYHRSLIQFSRNGINPLKLHYFSSRWYNVLFFLRLLIFEVNFIALQMLPRTQCVLIFLIQMCFGMFTWVSVFKYKIFSSCAYGMLTCVNESFITTFTAMCIWIAYEGPLKIGGQNWIKIQLATVTLIIIVATLNIILIIFTILGQMRIALREANRKKHRKRITNVDVTDPLLSYMENNREINSEKREKKINNNEKGSDSRSRAVKKQKKSKKKGDNHRVIKRNISNLFGNHLDTRNENGSPGRIDGLSTQNNLLLASKKPDE